MERFGLVGHPNAGKSSLFNVLTGSKILAAPYPFATIDSNVGVATVPDKRLDDLVNMSASKSIVPASVHFTDIGGLVEGASEGEGLGNKFLSAIREVDAIVYVLRAFASKELPDPMQLKEQLEILEVELSLADLESSEKQLDKRQRQNKSEKTTDDTTDALAKAVDLLGKGIPVYRGGLSSEEREALQGCNLLTNKPVMAVINIDENSISEAEIIAGQDEILAALGHGQHDSDNSQTQAVSICVGLEVEAMDFSPAERVDLFASLGIGQGALTSFLHSAYRLLGLSTFFTTGEKETRAWTFPTGSTAPECAGKIHTDMQRGFIRADCVPAEELLKWGNIKVAKDAGKVAGVGRDHLVDDGDVLEIFFNV